MHIGKQFVQIKVSTQPAMSSTFHWVFLAFSIEQSANARENSSENNLSAGEC